LTGFHYRVNDTSGGQGQNPPCAASVKSGSFPLLYWPQEFIENALYLGTDHVNDEYCYHFYMRPIPIQSKNYQLDIWTSTGDQYPCQISLQNIPQAGEQLIITTWSFTGFTTTIPTVATKQAAFAQIQCSESNWVCNAITNSTNADLQNALNYACSYVDCTAIQPGGGSYYPNTLLAHCNWAFNQYFQTYKLQGGYNSCYFGGVAQLVPPSSDIITKRNVLIDPLLEPLYPLDLVCSSL